eukprot:TRINITY_DN40595_c0_g1_i1.p1 TRINITY_DN40595_c0_g1~~TRINITY_DN40595_c0_g1_i1.p1  ORF type:complete len:427 (+),score=56.46 TRINITY_DN40595_c0_g1_i1:70-1350(+)
MDREPSSPSYDLARTNDTSEDDVEDDVCQALTSSRTPADPMSETAYRAILKLRQRKDWSRRCSSRTNADWSGSGTWSIRWPSPSRCIIGHLTQEQSCLRQDMARGKAVWSGKFWMDLWCFLSNTNPVIALLWSHPLHPISRWERVLVNMLSFPVIMHTLALIEIGRTCQMCNLRGCAEGVVPEGIGKLAFVAFESPIDIYAKRGLSNVYLQCKSDGADIMHGHIDLVNDALVRSWLGGSCCFASLLGLFSFSYEFSFLTPQMTEFLYCVVANAIFTLTCFQLMSCACVQAGSTRRRRLGEFVGRLVFALLAVWVVFRTKRLFYFVFVRNLQWIAIKQIVITKLLSWLGATVFNLLIFPVIFFIQRPKPEDSVLKWLDPPVVGRDSRKFIAKVISPRFNVLAAEYRTYVDQWISRDSGGDDEYWQNQ